MRRRAGRTFLLIAAAISVLLSACSPAAPGSPATPGGTIRVVTTTSVLGDLVVRVGGSRVAVTALVPRGGEVHTFDPRPADIAIVSEAGVIVTNGLGLDDWLASLARNAGATAAMVELGANLDGVEYVAGEEAGGVNPHLWLDPALATRYAERIRDALIAADPAGEATYRANADALTADLTELDTWARDQFARIPEGKRRIVSLHDAFPYFARAYDLEVVGVVVSVPGQDPSAGEVAALVETIRTSGVRAILSEVQFPTALADRIAEETGAMVVSDLYTDSLGDPPVDSYDALIRWDVERIVEALR